MIDKDKHLKMYNSCVAVQGAAIGVICDLQRGDFFFLPPPVIELLHNHNGKKVSGIYEEYASSTEVVDQYLEHLTAQELIFFTDTPENFPPMDTSVHRPFSADILILEADQLDDPKKDILNRVNEIGLVQVVFVFREHLDMERISEILGMLDKSKLQVISLVAKYREGALDFDELYSRSARLRDLVFYDADRNETIRNDYIRLTTAGFQELMTRRISGIDDFVLNLEAYLEAVNHNLFYFRKVYVDNEGNIKHYLDEEASYGNIASDDILEVIDREDYRELWNITKEQVAECSPCPFRYVCPDNRIPVGKSAEGYVHATPCNYDPQTNQWRNK